MPGILSGRPAKTAERKAADGDTANIGAGKHEEALARKGSLPPGMPEAPEELTAAGRRMYAYILRSDKGGRIFRNADGSHLAELAAVMADLARLRKVAARYLTIADKKAGRPEGSAALKSALSLYSQIEKQSARFTALSDRCGLSPLARARLELGVGGRDAADGITESAGGDLEMPAPNVLQMKVG